MTANGTPAPWSASATGAARPSAQPAVEQHGIRPLAREQGQRVAVTGYGVHHQKAGLLQDVLEKEGDQCLVLDDQDAGGGR